ncbi:MAG: exosortase-associated EpsI family protein [Planctomycetaceae bacterium]
MSTPFVAERRKPSDESPHDTTTPDGLRRSARHLSALIAAVLLLGGGIVQGTLSQRWQPATRSNGPETRLKLVPLKIGDWDGQDSAISQAERQMAGVTHVLSRTYTNRRTGEVVNVVLLSGPTGPLAVHPPTACYQGAGYQQAGATRETVIELPVAEVVRLQNKSPEAHRSLTTSTTSNATTRHVFAIADFYLPTRPEQSHPRIYWAWSAAGTWSVPESPRLEFSGSPVLFKLYVTCECPLGSQKTKAAPIDEFLRLLLLELQQQVFQNQ